MKKKFQSALFRPLGRWTGNDILSKGGQSILNLHESYMNTQTLRSCRLTWQTGRKCTLSEW